MSYLIDRSIVLRDREVIAVITTRRRGVNTGILLADGSVVMTLTRAKTLRNAVESSARRCKGLIWLNDRRRRRL
jgi:hypothetical protein